MILDKAMVLYTYKAMMLYDAWYDAVLNKAVTQVHRIYIYLNYKIFLFFVKNKRFLIQNLRILPR